MPFPPLAAAFGLLLLWVALRSLLWLAHGSRGLAGDDLLSFLLRLLASLLFWLPTLFIFFVLGSGTGFVLWFVVAIVLMTLSARRVAERRQTLLAVLAIAARRGVPLPTTLRALSGDEPGRLTRSARRLAETLEQGVALPDAIAQHQTALPRLAQVYARAGDQLDAVGPALEEASHAEAFSAQLWQGVAARVSYAVGLAFWGSSVVAFCMLKIVPAMQRIFDDFEMQLPPVTELLMQFTDLWVTFGWPLWAMVILLTIFAGGVGVVRSLGLSHAMPLIDGWATGRHSAALLRMCALATERERSLPRLFRLLGETYPQYGIGTRLLQVAHEVEHGRDWQQSLVAWRLLRPADAAVLEAAQQVGNLPWALRAISDQMLRRTAYRLQVVLDLGFPLVIFCFGIFMLLFSVGLFLPLVQIIHSLI